MTIGGIGGNTNVGTSAISPNSGGMDSYSKSLQKQIAEAQKQLQELSGNEEMSTEMKMKKRQELQKQISDLNMQLRQHQMEERRKAQQEKQAKQSARETKKGKDDEAGGLSKGSMQAMISAEGSLKLAKQQGSTANEMQNNANIKRTEIRLDGGGSTRTADDSAAISSKWDDVEGMEQKAKAATASQMSLLAKAQEEISKAGEEGGTNAKTHQTDRTDDSKKADGQNGISNGADEDKMAEGVAAPIVTGAAAQAIAMTQLQEEPEAPADAPTKQAHTAEIGSNVDVRI